MLVTGPHLSKSSVASASVTSAVEGGVVSSEEAGLAPRGLAPAPASSWPRMVRRGCDVCVQLSSAAAPVVTVLCHHRHGAV